MLEIGAEVYVIGCSFNSVLVGRYGTVVGFGDDEYDLSIAGLICVQMDEEYLPADVAAECMEAHRMRQSDIPYDSRLAWFEEHDLKEAVSC